MDYASAKERLKLIDEEACRASLASFKPGDDPAILNGLSAANQLAVQVVCLRPERQGRGPWTSTGLL